jgi:hypothetical protein
LYDHRSNCPDHSLNAGWAKSVFPGRAPDPSPSTEYGKVLKVVSTEVVGAKDDVWEDVSSMYHWISFDGRLVICSRGRPTIWRVPGGEMYRLLIQMCDTNETYAEYFRESAIALKPVEARLIDRTAGAAVDLIGKISGYNHADSKTHGCKIIGFTFEGVVT